MSLHSSETIKLT